MRYFKIFIFSGIIIFVISQYLHAQPNPLFYGDAGGGTYSVTMKKMEISKDGTNFVTIGEGDMAFDMASGSVGASIGNYVSNSSIPAGTYTTFRATMSRTQNIKGQGDYLATTYYTTTQNGTAGDFYKAITDAECVGGDCVASGEYEAVTFEVPADAEGEAGETLEIIGADMRTTKAFGNPIVVGEGTSQTISVSFNTASMIGFEEADPGEYIFYPMPPEESGE